MLIWAFGLCEFFSELTEQDFVFYFETQTTFVFFVKDSLKANGEGQRNTKLQF